MGHFCSYVLSFGLFNQSVKFIYNLSTFKNNSRPPKCWRVSVKSKKNNIKKDKKDVHPGGIKSQFSDAAEFDKTNFSYRVDLFARRGGPIKDESKDSDVTLEKMWTETERAEEKDFWFTVVELKEVFFF